MTERTILSVHADTRGSVRETYRASWDSAIPPIAQVVHSESVPHVMRAMHHHRKQYDIWHFTKGEAFVQLYDPKTDEGKGLWCGPEDTIVIPPGIAHGFYTPEGCTLIYLLTREYDGTDEFEFDALDLDWWGSDYWPKDDYIRSARDLAAQSFNEWLAKG